MYLNTKYNYYGKGWIKTLAYLFSHVGLTSSFINAIGLTESMGMGVVDPVIVGNKAMSKQS